MWNGILKSKSPLQGGKISVTVTYHKTGDETADFDEIYETSEVTDDQWLQKIVANRVAKLNTLEDFGSNLQEGAAVPAPTPETPVDPTPEPQPEPAPTPDAPVTSDQTQP